MTLEARRVPKQTKATRLDSVLADIDPSYSRSSWQKLIKAGHVRVDRQIVRDPSTKFNGGLVEFEAPIKTKTPPLVSVLYEDDDVVVFDKPAGMLTHSKGELNSEWTLADVARPKVHDDSTNRPGIVHRLDRATSGIIIVAKSSSAKLFLQRQFSHRRVFKQYLALVHGKLLQDQYSLDQPIGRNPRKPAQFRVDLGGKPAQTEVGVIRRLKTMTLVSLVPATGRTHQLRVHLSELGHPIVGDRLYGKPDSSQRLMLHAERLKLELPNGSTKSFRASLPSDWQGVIEEYA